LYIYISYKSMVFHRFLLKYFNDTNREKLIKKRLRRAFIDSLKN